MCSDASAEAQRGALTFKKRPAQKEPRGRHDWKQDAKVRESDSAENI